MEPYDRPFFALGLRLAGAMMLSMLLALVKLGGTHGISLLETMFWRQAIPTLAIGGWLLARGETGRLRTRRLGAHARRAAVGLTGMLFTLGVSRLLPLSEATVLGFTAPIFATMLAALLLHEKVGWTRWSAILLGFAGVAVIAGPDRAAIPLPGLVVGLVGPMLIALISIQVRDLGRTEEPVSVVFWFSAFSTAVLLPVLPFVFAPHDAAGWAILVGCGLTGLFGQIGITAALRYGAVSSVIVMDYSNFAWATLWGWLLFAQLPPATTWFGAPLVIGAGLVIVWREHRLARAKAVSSTA